MIFCTIFLMLLNWALFQRDAGLSKYVVTQLLGPNPEIDPQQPKPTAPTTPDACDSTMVLDAVTTLRGEMFFFKDRYQAY